MSIIKNMIIVKKSQVHARFFPIMQSNLCDHIKHECCKEGNPRSIGSRTPTSRTPLAPHTDERLDVPSSTADRPTHQRSSLQHQLDEEIQASRKPSSHRLPHLRQSPSSPLNVHFMILFKNNYSVLYCLMKIITKA